MNFSSLTLLLLIATTGAQSQVQAETNQEQQCSADLSKDDGTCIPAVSNENESKNLDKNKTKGEETYDEEEQEEDYDEEEFEDHNENCKAWAYHGECTNNPFYMYENCEKSCNDHDLVSKGVNNKEIGVDYSVEDDEDADVDTGVDLDDNCPTYAGLGECDVNPRFMREFCVKSCNKMDRKMLKIPSLKKAIKEEHKRLTKNKTDQCQLYMAESSIPHSGLGMYTAVPINIGDLIFHPEIVVSYFDNAAHFEKSYLQQHKDSDVMKEISEKKLVDKHENCGGWANDKECENNPSYMKSNCQKSCALVQSGIMDDFDPEDNWLPDSYYWDTSNTDSIYEAEVSDSLVPGIGALANSHTGLINTDMIRPAIDNAGLHRLNDPGVGAFSTHYNIGWKATDNIPAGMELFAEYGDSWFEGREGAFGPLPLSFDFKRADKLMKKFWEVVRTTDSFAQDLLTLTKELPARPNLRMAIPAKLEDSMKAWEKGTAILSVPNVIRSEEWLQENGMCLDNIRQDQSSILQAGRGAFSTRSIPKGTLVAPLPLIHMDKNRLKMWKESKDKTSYEYEKDQLLLNYCYGHHNSSVVVFPYSPITNFVNHNFNHSAINVKLQWSTSRYQKEAWFDKTAEEMFAEPYAGLMLEFVALRDIDEGEEIFIDYGKEWEAAWEAHVKDWKPSDQDVPPLYHLNSADMIRTVEEQKESPYAASVMTICFIQERVFDKGSSASWHRYPIFTHDVNIGKSFQCRVIGRTSDEQYEVVVINQSKSEVTVTNVPRHAIEFVYRQYSSDQHLKTAFRHPIAIPDEIFPSKWMDLI